MFPIRSYLVFMASDQKSDRVVVVLKVRFLNALYLGEAFRHPSVLVLDFGAEVCIQLSAKINNVHFSFIKLITASSRQSLSPKIELEGNKLYHPSIYCQSSLLNSASFNTCADAYMRSVLGSVSPRSA